MKLEIEQIIELTKAEFEYSNSKQNICVNKCATLFFAGKNDISFYLDLNPYGKARTTKAAIVFVPKMFVGWCGEAKAIARVENPYKAIIECAKILNKKEFKPAIIHNTAQISPYANVLGSVGANSVIGDFCSVPFGASIGENCVLQANVSIYQNVEIKNSTFLHSGVVVGSRGFGFYKNNKERISVPHFGGVVIGENCEIGSNSVIASGFLEATGIGNSCKLDSFVQIGHNCIVGNNVIFCSQSGLAGSVIVEDNVTLAGGAQVAGHLTLGEGCTIAAKAGVTKSVKPGVVVAGFPAVSIEKWRKKFLHYN